MDRLSQLKNRYLWAYGFAILVHLLLFVQVPLKDALMVPTQGNLPAESNPLTFEFVDVPNIPASETAPEKTPLIADRNLIAQDMHTQDMPLNHLPFSDGISQSKEAFETVKGDRQVQTPVPARTSQEATPLDAIKMAEDEGFDFSKVLHQNAEQTRRKSEKAVFGRTMTLRQSLAMSNQNAGALEKGGLQLSTYAWNFAPYLTYLKRHIEEHIFPPRAFELGIIDGTTRVRFRIMRNGALEGLEVLDYKGSPMLKDTSKKAVELSAQFKSLPADFPNEFLEIVGTFEYIILQ